MLRRAMGLRTRLLLALLVTSAITLLAAAAALLSPLQERLREQAASSLATTARQARPQFADAVRPRFDERRVEDEVFGLEARVDARVLVFNASVTGADGVVGEPLFDTSLGTTGSIREVYRALASGGDVEATTDDEARVALPFGEGRFVLVLRKPLTDVQETVDEVRTAFLGAAGIGLIASLVLGLLLTTTLLRRLERLRRTALRIEAEGMDAPVPRDVGRDEVGDLARAMARMQEGLRRQEAARRQFVATASHELRTPLTSLSGNLELLGEDLEHGDVDADDMRAQVVRAQEEVARMRNLATELLDLSRLDAGVALRSEPVELSEIVRAVSAEFALQAQREERELSLVTPPGPVWASGDPDAIARIARILLDNAIRYAGRGAAVRIQASYAGDLAALSVVDDGPGVPEDERERIFERFRRGSRTAGEGGFGLGLAIGRELAERLGGRLDLDPGASGTRFVLTLPIELPVGSQPPPAPTTA